MCIWPEHCLVGSNGHALVDDIWAALQRWTGMTGRDVEMLLKGQNPLTEMYSACAAEVPLTPTTSMNFPWIDSLIQPSVSSLKTTTTKESSGNHTLLVCGQAMSHCVNYTLRDIVLRWESLGRPCEIILVTDGCSAVPGFEDAAKDFQASMQAAGVKLATAEEVFA